MSNKINKLKVTNGTQCTKDTMLTIMLYYQMKAVNFQIHIFKGFAEAFLSISVDENDGLINDLLINSTTN